MSEKPKIHKRYERNVVIGETVRCGLPWFIIPDKFVTWKWKNVTCKNCLRFKPPNPNNK